MIDNRTLVDFILHRRGVAKDDRDRLCGDTSGVNSIAEVIMRSINPDPIDHAVREYWASQKVDDPSDELIEDDE